MAPRSVAGMARIPIVSIGPVWASAFSVGWQCPESKKAWGRLSKARAFRLTCQTMKVWSVSSQGSARPLRSSEGSCSAGPARHTSPYTSHAESPKTRQAASGHERHAGGARSRCPARAFEKLGQQRLLHDDEHQRMHCSHDLHLTALRGSPAAQPANTTGRVGGPQCPSAEHASSWRRVRYRRPLRD